MLVFLVQLHWSGRVFSYYASQVLGTHSLSLLENSLKQHLILKNKKFSTLSMADFG